MRYSIRLPNSSYNRPMKEYVGVSTDGWLFIGLTVGENKLSQICRSWRCVSAQKARKRTEGAKKKAGAQSFGALG